VGIRNLYSSRNICTVIKSKSMKWTELVTCMLVMHSVFSTAVLLWRQGIDERSIMKYNEIGLT